MDTHTCPDSHTHHSNPFSLPLPPQAYKWGASLPLPPTSQIRSILSNFQHPSDRALPKRDQVKMQFNRPTFNRLLVVPELRYPPGVLVERELRVWAISRWRGSVKLTRAFLRAGYAHLPRGSPRMFTLNEVHDRGGILLLLTVTFTNPFDARELLGQVFWCGCEAIFFTVYNLHQLREYLPHSSRDALPSL